MKRREFLARCARWAAAAPTLSLLAGCLDDQTEDIGLYSDFDVDFDGTVLIIGAGAAGLGAGYLLDRYGVGFEVLEASGRYGGRVKRIDDFADFPIDLGAEWIHDHPSILASLIDDPDVTGSIEVVPYSPESVSVWHGGELSSANWVRNVYQEYKFASTTWFGFLERYIAPAVRPRIRFDHPVTTIDSRGSRVVVTTADGATFEADRVLVTVPVKVLQDGLISFLPALGATRQAAIDGVDVPHGIKVFSAFDRRFYPDATIDGPLLDDSSTDKLYYDAAFGKDTSDHVLGLFWVADEAARLTRLDSDAAIVQATLADLDAIFDGAASRHHIGSVVQNWTAEPFIRGAYSVGYADSGAAFTAAMGPIDGRVFFAGEALAEGDNTVPGAMKTGYRAVEMILAG